MTRFLATLLAIVGSYFIYVQVTIDRSQLEAAFMEELRTANRLALRLTEPSLIQRYADEYADAMLRVMELDARLDGLEADANEAADHRADVEALKLKCAELNRRLDQAALYWPLSPERREKFRAVTVEELFRVSER